MRAVVVAQPGGPEVMSVAEVPDAAAGPGEVLIRVVATAVNRADLHQRSGNYPPPPGASQILGLECSGIVVELGPEVTGWTVGDEVCALLAGGGYAELVAVPVTQVMRRPPSLDLVAAAAVPETACTVWSMVFDAAGLGIGETLLVHGGTSGIGTTAIQLARAAGARVFATAGSAQKVQFCLDLGAELAINYREKDFEAVIADHTAKAGVDVILDTVGAAYLKQNVASLAIGGRLSVIGMAGGAKGELNLSALMSKRGTIHSAGLRARPLEQKATIVAGTEAHVWPLIATGALRPVIDRVFPLEEVVAAHQLVESSSHIGKVVLSVA